MFSEKTHQSNIVTLGEIIDSPHFREVLSIVTPVLVGALQDSIDEPVIVIKDDKLLIPVPITTSQVIG